MSYFFFAITFPISIFFCVKTLRQEERLVVFRLGKMIGKEEREGEKEVGDVSPQFARQERRVPAESWSSPGWTGASRRW